MGDRTGRLNSTRVRVDRVASDHALVSVILVRWLMSNKIAKSPLLGHSLENSLSKVLFPEELNGLVPQSLIFNLI